MEYGNKEAVGVDNGARLDRVNKQRGGEEA